MQPLVDADILLYEIGYAAETGWKAIKGWKEGDAPLDPPPWDYVAELLENRIANICGEVMATEKPRFFLTGKDNFRFQIAKKQPYKDRPGHKPWHYANIKAYLIGHYGAEVVDGMEADDMICIVQTKDSLDKIEEGKDFYEITTPYTIICTRDKDLRQCPGYHYGWELGHQPAFGPMFVDEFGKIELKEGKNELKGYGGMFFYAQMIIGDKVDSIPGIPGYGPAKAIKILGNAKTLDEAEEAVVEAYKGFYGDNWYEELMEQAHLLWMIRELDDEGRPVMFKLQKEYE